MISGEVSSSNTFSTASNSSNASGSVAPRSSKASMRAWISGRICFRQARGHVDLVADRRAVRTPIPPAPVVTCIRRIQALHQSGQMLLHGRFFHQSPEGAEAQAGEAHHLPAAQGQWPLALWIWTIQAAW